jgi:hypothetical protein
MLRLASALAGRPFRSRGSDWENRPRSPDIIEVELRLTLKNSLYQWVRRLKGGVGTTEMRGIAVTVLPIAPLTDASFAARLAAVLPSQTQLAGGRLIVMAFELDTLSHIDVFRSALAGYDQTRCLVIRARSASPELFSQALRVAPRELSALNASILERCMPARALRVTSSNGTDLRIRLDPRPYGWISVRGRSRPGSFTIIPADEGATSPASINGVLVADFAIHVNVMTSLDVRLQGHPVTGVIEYVKRSITTAATATCRVFSISVFR